MFLPLPGSASALLRSRHACACTGQLLTTAQKMSKRKHLRRLVKKESPARVAECFGRGVFEGAAAPWVTANHRTKILALRGLTRAELEGVELMSIGSP